MTAAAIAGGNLSGRAMEFGRELFASDQEFTAAVL